jgi:cation/acetate symporter
LNYQPSPLAIGVFVFFVLAVLGFSAWLGRRAKSSSGYFAAHGQVPWFINGVAFAGDYLSAASFLGICGMIAFYGYDGFLYSIGFLAGWVVALFVIAEPIKRLGKFTFADALNAKFNSRGITLAAAISTLVVSVFYLIPQMVGAGALIQPLLGFSHTIGVLIVGTVVTLIVVTAGMVSTTWVQFIKGSLLVVFCAMLAIAILARGLRVNTTAADAQPRVVTPETPRTTLSSHDQPVDDSVGIPLGGKVAQIRDLRQSTGPLGPIEFFDQLNGATIVRWTATPSPTDPSATVFTPAAVRVETLMTPGGSPMFKGVRSGKLADKLDFISLMLALFAGTASLPHILIRYYTVKDAAAARKSTVVGIASIGFFYVLTLYLGLGAMTSGMLDVTNSNMAAPLLARTFGEFPFAVISAIAFTTVLGTVSGLILAASGAVAHDLIETVMGHHLKESAKVGAAKWAAVVIGIIAMALGVLFEKLNVGFLVGWAFNVAASANLPALVMLLFWRGTTRQGMIWGILVGLFSSLAWLLLSGPAFKDVYGLDPASAPMPFSQPGLVTIPLGFIVLIAVSLLTRERADVVAR